MTRASAALLVAACFFVSATLSPVSAAPTQLQPAVERLKPFIAAGISDSLTAARALREHVARQDLAGAQQDWLAARGGWERAEIVSDEFFPDLDDAIDAWPNGRIGFHAIEARLFGAKKIDVAGQIDDLIANLTLFQEKLGSARLTPQGLLNGTTKLAFEIGENKADGGESQISGTSLGDIRANLTGIAEAYRTVFGPALQTIDPKRDAAVVTAIDGLAKVAEVADLKSLDEAQLRDRSEQLVLALQDAAKPLGLERPNLGD
jgi:iron uptake system component EfeO